MSWAKVWDRNGEVGRHWNRLDKVMSFVVEEVGLRPLVKNTPTPLPCTLCPTFQTGAVGNYS